ncbi:quorum-sensing autoinducer synthase [Myxococcus sp. CA056]|uniref:alpha-hydroxyketone-type quorum-sensing autoinducer synthase n=1 Tax=Myxococcus sp. CA056 TaxID=2741740 RepID=UPI00157A3C10|nr:alpha-hydroxyketone-type quorum-sensing autoinducer synthase [Myxococcus sp. CA056]NTX17166.1 quorum-sensing autoinducer synthase [Myxococcus sp. CA056]
MTDHAPEAKATEGVSPPVPGFLQRKLHDFEKRIQRWESPRHILDGLSPGPGAILLNGNDYLSLSKHPRLAQAAMEAVSREGLGAMMSGVFQRGEHPRHTLEQRLAALLRAESGILCQSGYCANVGLLECLADEQVPVYIDRMAHVSLWRGIRSAGATAVPFRHNDVDDLRRRITRLGPGVIAVDSVYSTNGSVCPLADVAELASRHGCVLLVDESHSLGTHGPRGAGMVVGQGLLEHVHFRTASLSKAFVGRAGFVACMRGFERYFEMTSGPAVFSSAVLPHDIAALLAALDLIRDADARRQRLHLNAASLRARLEELGYDLDGGSSQILALQSGLEARTLRLKDALEARGIFGSVFCDPATPVKHSLVRLSVHSELSQDDLDHVVDACREIRDEVGLSSWASTRRHADVSSAALPA